MKKIRKYLIVVVLLSGSFLLFSFQKDLFEISKNIDIFVTLYKELNANYVDDIRSNEITLKGINAMLESLDPYTEFIPEEYVDDYKKVHVSHEYGGIGALVQQIDNEIVVAEPYFGFPAQKADVRAGDVILKINETEVGKNKVEDVSNLLRGLKGSQLKLTIRREGENQPLVKNLVREEIKIKNVSYAGLIAPETGYIKLDKFLDNCSGEVKDAFLELKQKEKIKSLVLDLRGNGGGILQEAVKISNFFLPKGQLIVSQKGKTEGNNYSYYAEANPLDTEIPLVILVDNYSASASEIVAGAMQDSDRGIIIGKRTFGKGLVQQTLSLAYNSLLKVTIAKYYTPSGRCIQTLDYTHRKTDGTVAKVADSLITEFKTKNGRLVYDGSGIYPDVANEHKAFHTISSYLSSKFLIFNFATRYRARNEKISPARQFSLSDDEYDSFVSLVKEAGFEYKTVSEQKMEAFQKTAEKENYFKEVKTSFDIVKEKLAQQKKNDLVKFKPEIKELLESEICSRYYFYGGRLESTFDDDKDIQSALEILNNPAKQKAILKGEGDYKSIGKPASDKDNASSSIKSDKTMEEGE